MKSGLYELSSYFRTRKFVAGVAKRIRGAGRCLLIYQMGRVASQTINDTAKQALPGVPVVHVHWLSDKNLASAIGRARGRYGFVRQRHLLVARKIRALLDSEEGRSLDWLVISVVRDPVARNLSEYFLTLEEYHFKDAFKIYRDHPEQIDQWVSYFVHEYDHLSRCRWFDEEIGEVLGVNVLDVPFDHERKFLLHEGRIKVLVLRQEDLETGLANGFQALTGVRPEQIARRHISSEDEHAGLYRALVERVKLPEVLLDRIYGCPWVRHFYGEDEIEVWRRKWRAGS